MHFREEGNQGEGTWPVPPDLRKQSSNRERLAEGGGTYSNPMLAVAWASTATNSVSDSDWAGTPKAGSPAVSSTSEGVSLPPIAARETLFSS